MKISDKKSVVLTYQELQCIFLRKEENSSGNDLIAEIKSSPDGPVSEDFILQLCNHLFIIYFKVRMSILKIALLTPVNLILRNDGRRRKNENIKRVENFRQKEKDVLDSILGAKNSRGHAYDARIRPQSYDPVTNETGILEIARLRSAAIAIDSPG